MCSYSYTIVSFSSMREPTVFPSNYKAWTERILLLNQQVLPETYQQKAKLRQLGGMWAHQGNPFSPLISSYVQFLVQKVDFHHKVCTRGRVVTYCICDRCFCALSWILYIILYSTVPRL